MKSSLNRMVKNMKKKELLVTPRLDQWLMLHGANGLIIDDRTFEFIKYKWLAANNSDRSGRFGASSRGTCMRAQIFGFQGRPQNRGADSVLQQIFLDGTFRHIRWQIVLKEAGILTDIEVRCIMPTLNLASSMDGMNSVEKWGFELKGTSQFQQACKAPFESHVLQVHTYMIAANLNKFSLVYEDKQSQEWKEHIVKYDPHIAKVVYDELKLLNESINNKKLPEVMPVCRGGDSDTFKRCPYSHFCLEATWTGINPRARASQTTAVKKIGRRKKLPHHR
jgi:hypothetical protein